MPSHLVGVLSGLLSAIIWGSGDFAGGLAARRNSQFQVLSWAALVGLGVLIPSAMWRGEPLPGGASLFWSMLAGTGGVLGLAALYQGLAVGNAAVVSPTAGVIGAALPVITGTLLEGLPGASQLIGIFVGILGIGLVSRVPAHQSRHLKRDLTLALAAGVCFGTFFVSLDQVEPGLLFSPLVVSKVVAFLLAGFVMLRQRGSLLSVAGNSMATAAGLLDAGGNFFYLLATQYTRLDVAAVISSMYPAATVLLARLVLRQAVAPLQWLGLICCLVGVGLIAA